MRSRGVIDMKNPQDERTKQSAVTRRQLMEASLLGAGLAGSAAKPLLAASAHGCQPAKSIVDAHVHLWKLPRNAPPMSDSATFPTGCCGSVPWMEVDRLIPDYNARVGGPEVDKVVLIESSVGVPPDRIIQSNLWMLQEA